MVLVGLGWTGGILAKELSEAGLKVLALERGGVRTTENDFQVPGVQGVQGVGPSLRGVFGRRAGAADDFRFSPALKRSGITWNAQTIDAYIADPQQAVPAEPHALRGHAGCARPL